MTDRDPDEFAQFAEMFENASRDERRTAHGRGPVDPTIRTRRRKRGRVFALAVVGAIVAAIAVYVPVTLNAPVGAAAATVERPDVPPGAPAALVMPSEGESAISVSGADASLGASASGILASSGGDAAVPMASISKLITALVILNAKPLTGSDPGPSVTFSKADHALYDKYYLLNATIAAMPTGSSMSERNALETMLVVSACNYAEALADWAFGSNAGFVSAAKKWLAANGLSHTTMVESTGIDARNTSTPSDLIALGKLAMANPAIPGIVAKTGLDIPFLTGMPSTNTLLGADGVNGIKTGTLEGSGSDLLFSAKVSVTGLHQPLTVIGVVLGGATRETVNTDVTHLIDSLKAGFHEVPVAKDGEKVGTYTTPWGASATMVLGSSASVFTYSNAQITSTMTTLTLKTGKNGEKVGSVTWTAGTRTVTAPVVLQGSIAPPTAWWRLTHPLELGH
ncbi:MAG TPA: D-alanyl-D-alanine carboxypeptidase [Pseudolysinimonas sp.]|nr:D-alanyl-D-alanine carboxypeptidase [Pseudolysinimonas sp.]